MDFADKAFEFQEQFILESILKIKHSKNNKKLLPTGYCHFCEEKIDGNKLFCNNICADKYEKIKK